jgi:hypothetical protein
MARLFGVCPTMGVEKYIISEHANVEVANKI